MIYFGREFYLRTIITTVILFVGAAVFSFWIYTHEDITRPTGSILIDGGATCTTSRSVTLTLSAEDPESDVVEMRFRNRGGDWSDWEPYSTSKSWTLSSGNGTKIVEVQFKNGAKLTAISHDTIKLDTTPPTGNIVIEGGASYTTSPSVTLTLSAKDTETGVSRMRFRNRDGTWSPWETYTKSKSWTLPSSGNKRKIVEAQFKNKAGLESAIYSDDIILRT
jgi:hypothetical protein